MHVNLNTIAALVLAAVVSSAPVLAFANDSASVVNAAKTDVLPVGNLTDMIGEWTAGDLNFLDKATSIKVFDTKQLYPAADLSKIASAETSKNAQLGKFRDAIRSDAGLTAWFLGHDIDINRVVAVADPKGSPEIFLY